MLRRSPTDESSADADYMTRNRRPIGTPRPVRVRVTAQNSVSRCEENSVFLSSFRYRSTRLRATKCKGLGCAVCLLSMFTANDMSGPVRVHKYMRDPIASLCGTAFIYSTSFSFGARFDVNRVYGLGYIGVDTLLHSSIPYLDSMLLMYPLRCMNDPVIFLSISTPQKNLATPRSFTLKISEMSFFTLAIRYVSFEIISMSSTYKNTNILEFPLVPTKALSACWSGVSTGSNECTFSVLEWH